MGQEKAVSGKMVGVSGKKDVRRPCGQLCRLCGMVWVMVCKQAVGTADMRGQRPDSYQ